MKTLFVFLFCIISTLSFSKLCTPSQEGSIILPKTTKIGILSAFPEPYGMFYQNRIIHIKNKKQTSLFPESPKVLFNTNELILGKLKTNLMKNFPKHQIVNLGTVDPSVHLTGYFIEGIWGPEAKGIHLKNAPALINKNDLDVLVVIVPTTYHIPKLKKEGTGFGLFYLDNKATYVYASYAIKVYKKSDIKPISSNKQVLIDSIKIPKQPDLKQKKYPQETIFAFKIWINNTFMPKISKQINCLLQKPYVACTDEFSTPKKPFGYYLPH